MLTPRKIIATAWHITTTETSLKRWGFFSSFFETLLDVKLLIYQIYFLYDYFYKGGEGGFFDVEIIMYHSVPFWLFVSIILSFLILLVIELFVPHLATGAIIGLAAKAYRKEKVTGGLILALYNFFPVFAIHEIFVFSSFSMMVTVESVILRYFGGLNYTFMIIALFIWVLSNCFKLFFTFAEEGVVIQKLSIYNASSKSIKLIMSNIKHMVFLTMLMLIISVRIVINAVIILLLPTLIVGISIFMTYFFTPIISFSIASIVGVILVFVASYFFTYLHVFRQTVWTITFIELCKEKELDHIE